MVIVYRKIKPGDPLRHLPKPSHASSEERDAGKTPCLDRPESRPRNL